MAGHSKWANVKHRKERADAKKGKLFSRVTKEIISAVKLGGPDPKKNSRLKMAIQKAKDVNLPLENIERNIKRASSGNAADYTSISYELYGYGGVGIIAEALTDNKNRLASDMRIATNKCGGTIATPGAVAFNFDKKGVLHVLKEVLSEEDLFLCASEAGAQDFDIAEQFYLIITDPSALYSVKEVLEGMGAKVSSAELEMLPRVRVECDEETARLNMALIEWLENLDDVDAVYHNMG